MRFCFKCLVVLGLLWRAILVAQGRSGDVAPTLAYAGARAGQAVSQGVAEWCRGDVAACVEDAARLQRLIAVSDGSTGERSTRPGLSARAAAR